MIPDLDAILRSTEEPAFKSQGERRIAEFLDRCGVRYMYESPVAIEHRGQLRLWYPDFYLPDLGVYVEYYGVQGEPNYEQGILQKNMAYKEAGLAVISLYPTHLRDNCQRYLAQQIYAVLRARLQTAEDMLNLHAMRNHYRTSLSVKAGHSDHRNT